MRIFISYSSQNREDAEYVYSLLSARGVDVFIDYERIRGGEDFIERLAGEIRKADWIVLLISENSVQSRYVRAEVQFAFSEAKPFVPIRLDNAALPDAMFFLRPIHQIRFRRSEHFAADVLNALGLSVETRQVPQPQPSPIENYSQQIRQAARSRLFIAAAAVSAILILVWVITQLYSNGVQQIGSVPTATITDSLALIPTSIITIPSPTQPITAIASATRTSTPTATSVRTDTPTPSATLTPTRTSTHTLTPSLTHTPTRTLPPSPIPTNDPVLQPEYNVASAYNYGEGNAAWTPVTHAFNEVDMVLVPPGCFMMGALNGGEDERPVEEQCFENPFWIDRTEVTQADFERLGGEKGLANRFNGDSLPVERIDWYEASTFCQLRGMRLPTEREWEYAARGPDALTYPWGNEWSDSRAVSYLVSMLDTRSVGTFRNGASWVGALDMSGNIAEWVSSLYLPYPYNSAAERQGNNTDHRVIRGGSFYEGLGALRSAGRYHWLPTLENYFTGFRCAWSP